MEEVESGFQRLVIEPELTRMFTESSNRFLLSACLVGEEFRISQHAQFLDYHDVTQQNSGQSDPRGRYCFVLRRQTGSNVFALFSLACENCDNRLGRYTCELVSSPPSTPITTPVAAGGDSRFGSFLPENSAMDQIRPTPGASPVRQGAAAPTEHSQVRADAERGQQNALSKSPPKGFHQALASLGISISLNPRGDPRDDAPRQRLAEITQSVCHNDQADVDIRCLSVTLPRVFDDFSRAVWCPRNRKGHSIAGASPRPVMPVHLSMRAAALSGLPTTGIATAVTARTFPAQNEQAGSPGLEEVNANALCRKLSGASIGGGRERSSSAAFTMGPDGLPLPPGVTASPRQRPSPLLPSVRQSSMGLDVTPAPVNSVVQRSSSFGDLPPTPGSPFLGPPTWAATPTSRRLTSVPLEEMQTVALPTPQGNSPSGMASAMSPSTPAMPNAGAFIISSAAVRKLSAGASEVTTPRDTILRRNSVETQAITMTKRGLSDAMTMMNRTPEWNTELGSLTMKFLGGRIAESSSKNFLMELLEHSATGTEAGISSSRVPSLQFGKLKAGRFSCDFRFPLCPAQALGIMLSAFFWTIPSADDN